MSTTHHMDFSTSDKQTVIYKARSMMWDQLPEFGNQSSRTTVMQVLFERNNQFREPNRD